MKLASLKSGGRDGTLIVVDRALDKAVSVPDIAPTLQHALDHWSTSAPQLEAVYQALNSKKLQSFSFEPSALAAPLPRAYQWLDGSAYLSHVERVRKARGAEMPASFYTDPLMYQGGSDGFLGSQDPICITNEDWGIDFEAEVAVVTDDVAMGSSSREAADHIRLFMLVNDVSLRNLIPNELAKGFGFIHGKPATAFSPVAVTPDELGDAWDGNRVYRPLVTYWNDELFGNPEAGEGMHFDFSKLISHAAMTRHLGAGTIVGSGTVSNADETRGCSCIVERRVLEMIKTGETVTRFMRFGDRVRIEMRDPQGASIFGAIDQSVTPWPE